MPSAKTSAWKASWKYFEALGQIFRPNLPPALSPAHPPDKARSRRKLILSDARKDVHCRYSCVLHALVLIVARALRNGLGITAKVVGPDAACDTSPKYFPMWLSVSFKDFLSTRRGPSQRAANNQRCDKILRLSGMFRHSASLAIPHLKSFAAIPSVSLVQLGHTNRNVFLSHESQREVALV